MFTKLFRPKLHKQNKHERHFAIQKLIDVNDDHVKERVKRARSMRRKSLEEAFGASTPAASAGGGGGKAGEALAGDVIGQLLSSGSTGKRGSLRPLRSMRRMSTLSSTAPTASVTRLLTRTTSKGKAIRANAQKILGMSVTTQSLMPSTVARLLQRDRGHEKAIVDTLDSIEVTVHGVRANGAYTTSNKLTYVQVNWVNKRKRRFTIRRNKKVKTALREGTDNPVWGPDSGRFMFENCKQGGKVLIKVKELHSFGRRVNVGTAKISGKMIPRDGTQVTFDLQLKLERSKKIKAEIRVTVGKNIFSEPAIGENGYWPPITVSSEAGYLFSSDLAPERRKSLDAPTSTSSSDENRPKFIILSVLNARGVFDADSSGTSDPYVKIGFDTTPVMERYVTKTKNMTRFPVWNQRFFLRVPEDSGCRALVLTVWDRDVFSSPDFLGAAAIPLSAISRGGALNDYEIELKRRITPDTAGESCHIHPRATNDLGVIRVQVSELVEQPELFSQLVPFGEIKVGVGLSLARNVHVAVVAARHLFRIDGGGGSCDAFAYVSVDNAPSNEFCRTSTVSNTLHPVWNDGIGEVFTLIARPGAGRVMIDLYDRDIIGTTLMGQAHVSLAGLPADGSWAEMVTPLYGKDVNRNFLVGGTDASLAWNSPDRIKGEIIVRVSSTLAPYPNLQRPPAIAERDRYKNQHMTNKYLYVQALSYAGMPMRHNMTSTNARIVMSLNTHKQLVYGEVQKDVMSDFDFETDVHAFPKTHLSRTLTIQLLSELAPVYGSKQMFDFSKHVMQKMGFMKDEPDEAKKKKDAAAAGDDGDAKLSVEEGERFMSGVPIGFVQIRIDHMKVGDLKRHKIKLNTMLNEKSWLQAKEGALGEIELVLGCGYLKKAPLDLRVIDRAARPTLGTFMFNIESVIGDPTPNWNIAPFVAALPSRQAPTGRNKFGKHVAATVMWDGREENIVSSHELFQFHITEATGDVRVLFTSPDVLNGGSHLLGAVSIPIQTIMESPGRSVDAWYNIVPPNSSFLTEEEMASPSHAMCVYLRSKRILSDWQGYARLRVSFSATRAEWKWYLRQSPPEQKCSHVPDTVEGVVTSFNRLVESVLSPVKLYARAAVFVAAHPSRHKMNAAWFTWHTTCCWIFRSEIVSSFFLLWLVSGMFFSGYCAHIIAEEVYGAMSAFEGDANGGEAVQLRLQVKDLNRKKNRKFRTFKDALLEQERLLKLRAKGRAVEVSAQAVKKGMKERKAKRAQQGVDDELPNLPVMPANFAHYVLSVLISNNPAELVLSFIQSAVWKLLKIIKDAGATLVRFDKVITSGGPRLMPSTCKSIGSQLETLADTLDRPVHAITWDNVALSQYFSMLSIALTFTACLVLLIFRKFVDVVDYYSPIRLWHLVWIVGVVPVLPFTAPFVIRNCIGVETFLQTIGMYVPVVPVSLNTIRAVRDNILAEFKDDYAVLRARAKQEFEQQRKVAHADSAKARRAKIRSRYESNSGNPIVWIRSALSRAPTSMAVIHARRVRAFMRPGEGPAPDFTIFREDAQVGRSVAFGFGQIVSYLLAIPLTILTAPARILAATMEHRLNLLDTLARIRADECFAGNLPLPFGEQKIEIVSENQKALGGGKNVVKVENH